MTLVIADRFTVVCSAWGSFCLVSYDDDLLGVAASWEKLSVSFVDNFSPCTA